MFGQATEATAGGATRKREEEEHVVGLGVITEAVG